MYRHPPEEVVRIVDASPTPFIRVSPDGAHMLLIHYTAMPPLEMVAEPFHKLAGLRINARSGVTRSLHNLTSLSYVVRDGEDVAIAIPEHFERISYVVWSPCSSRFAVIGLSAEGLELWVAEVADLELRRVGDFVLNDVLNSEFFWMPGGERMLVCAVPEGRGAAPEAPLVASGPQIEVSDGTAAQNRTYQDLLETAYDDALFVHYATSQLKSVGLDGVSVDLGEPAMFNGLAPSPSGEFLYVNTLDEPLSHVVPVGYFGRTQAIWSATTGELVRSIETAPAAEAVPIYGTPTWARGARWLAHEPASLRWTKALDGGDPKAEVEHRDAVMVWSAPFEGEPEELFRTEGRFRGVYTLSRPGEVIAYDYDWRRRWITATLRDLRDPSVEPRVLFERSVQDRYSDIGSPITTRRPDGYYVVEVDDDGCVWLAGSGASESGDRPFVARWNLETLEVERVLESTGDWCASFSAFVRAEDGSKNLLLYHQSPKTPANYAIFDPNTGEREELTSFADPHPDLTGLEKKILKYERDDGVALSGTLYLPPGAQPGDDLPLVVWAYPREYNDASTAGQVRATTNTFTRLSGTSPLMFLTQGYAVLAGAAMPIIGDPETMNDTFIEQLTSSARAAITAAGETGYVDTTRVGVGGHSYGAFMVANLLAHTDLFRAGIARSGAYNRSLTPYGFQGERRTLWQAPDTYIEVSPLFAADRITDPILFIHGVEDQNSGTYPLQSRRMFHALKGQGAVSRLVMLPHESHGYRARASILHVLAESFDWFERYVRDAPERAGAEEE